jgi:glycosyltransferase involved in cell wall biosynthesis
MSSTIILDFLSDPMGGLLASARAFLNHVRSHDQESRFVVLEANGAVSAAVDDRSSFDWVDVCRPQGLRGWRRILWQNTELPDVARRSGAQLYISMSHYLPRMLPPNLGSVIGVSNLAPFSVDAYEAEVAWRAKLRLRVLRRTILSACRGADRVVALSEACRAELTARGIPAGKIAVIPNGVSPAEAPERRLSGTVLASCGVRDGGFFLCVSHFYRYKNFERLVRAYAMLVRDTPQAPLLLLVGAPYDPAYCEGIRALVARLGLEERVRIIPGVYGGALLELYRSCAAFVFPSLIENSPITLLEAMREGAAVAASDIPAMREMGGDAALYFDPRSEQAIAGALLRILQHVPQNAALRERGRQRVKAYTWDGYTGRLVRLYRELYALRMAARQGGGKQGA